MFVVSGGEIWLDRNIGLGFGVYFLYISMGDGLDNNRVWF